MAKVEMSPEKKYDIKLKRRIKRVYLIMIIMMIPFLNIVITVYGNKTKDIMSPEIDRATEQVSYLLPKLKENEKKLRETYENIRDIRDRELKYLKEKKGNDVYFDNEKMIEEDLESLISDTLTWTEQVIRIKVGQEGSVVVLDKEGKIIAHPNEKYKGVKLVLNAGIMDGVNFSFYPINTSTGNLDKLEDFFDDLLNVCMVGRLEEYDGKYVLIGIPFSEVFVTVVQPVFTVFVVTLVALWLLAKYISLSLIKHENSINVLKRRFKFSSVVTAVLVFSITLYYQSLTDVTRDLKTIDSHARVAAETMDSYKAEKERIDTWLDDQYLLQTVFFARALGARRTYPDKELVLKVANVMRATYIFIFDMDGNLVVTNSPYDRIVLGEDSNSWTKPFVPLLEGVEAMVGDVVLESYIGEEIQYFGASIKDANYDSVGAVIIGMPTDLRRSLTEHMDIDSVLENTIIGLPDHALAINKKTKEITNSTIDSIIGMKAKDIGISNKYLKDNYSGFISLDGKEYYAGVRETKSHYFVPLASKTFSIDPFFRSLSVALFILLCSLFMVAMALFHYDKSVVEADPKRIVPEKGPEGDADADPNGESDDNSSDENSDEITAESIEEEELLEEKGILRGLSNLVKSRDNEWGFEERWNMTSVPKNEQSAEERMKKIIDVVLLILCLVSIFPVISLRLTGADSVSDPTGLLYIASGNWEKGFNIFAVSSCIFLICLLYVLVVFLSRILYQISKYSNSRIETVCLLIRTSLKYVCVILFVYYGLSQFGVDTRTLLASAGILSMMIGFGAKELVTDVLAGIFMIFEGTLRVGDFISLGDFWGTVQQIGIRTTRVEWFGDIKMYNNSQLSNIVNCRGEVTRRTIKVKIGYEENLERVEQILEAELPKMTDKLYGAVSAPRYQGVAELAANGVVLRFVVYAKSPLRMVVERCFFREIKLIFDKYGITIPYPQLTVHEPNVDVKTNDEAKGDVSRAENDTVMDGDVLDEESFEDLNGDDDGDFDNK
ncbi:MAG: mechanosensitive ion channel [Lachnospiraceae bacterium]|nr:mechanosensitive ion channel [Lachnospiraceae bacterium]